MSRRARAGGRGRGDHRRRALKLASLQGDAYAPGCEATKARVESNLPTAPRSRKNDGSRPRDLEQRLVEALGQLQIRDRELVEVQEQQAATAEILRVISQSPTDAQPVFDAIARSAMRLCEATRAALKSGHCAYRADSDEYRTW